MSTTAKLALPLAPLGELPRTAASEVKKQGWKSVMRAVTDNGKLLITNHDTPEAVILSTREYLTLVEALQNAQARQMPTLGELREQFDARLASLNRDDAGEKLRALMNRPARLGGKVKAGTGF